LVGDATKDFDQSRAHYRLEYIELCTIIAGSQASVTGPGDDLVASSEELVRRCGYLRSVAPDEILRVLVNPGVIRCQVVRYKIQNKEDPTLRQCRTSRRQPSRAPDSVVDHETPHAVWRANDITRFEVTCSFGACSS
jgi:hypothetical protein